MRSQARPTATLLATTALLFALVPAAHGARFRPDDPLERDPDDVGIAKPAKRPLSKAIDLLQKTFRKPEGGSVGAVDVNTLGEVPNSSWFENRMSQRVLSIAELVRGPNQGDGPDLTKPWLIVAAKTEGVTPGFRIKDARGDVYFIKFDSLNWPEMATSSEVIGTKFFYAFGYNVPENYLVRWHPDYEVSEEAKVEWDTGLVTHLSKGYVDYVLKRVPRRGDGTIQLIASKALPGSPIGPFDFQGTRKDDPNDLFVHEDRRELRGHRIFCSWINHNDSDSVNTLDTYVGQPGAGRVRHNLIDFGTVLGSGAIEPHARRVGNEYYLELAPALKSAATLGIWDRPWRDVKYKMYKSVGRFESEYFRPEKWKPDYPNPAHDRMQLDDAFWAVRTVSRFSDEAIHAIVATGQHDDPEAAAYVEANLIVRRDKIVRYYFALMNPIDAFTVSTDSAGWSALEFENLGVAAGLASSCHYEYEWDRLENETGARAPGVKRTTSSTTSIPVPADGSAFLIARIGSYCDGMPAWQVPVEVTLRMKPTPRVVGIDRLATTAKKAEEDKGKGKDSAALEPGLGSVPPPSPPETVPSPSLFPGSALVLNHP